MITLRIITMLSLLVVTYYIQAEQKFPTTDTSQNDGTRSEFLEGKQWKNGKFITDEELNKKPKMEWVFTSNVDKDEYKKKREKRNKKFEREVRKKIEKEQKEWSDVIRASLTKSALSSEDQNTLTQFGTACIKKTYKFNSAEARVYGMQEGLQNNHQYVFQANKEQLPCQLHIKQLLANAVHDLQQQDKINGQFQEVFQHVAKNAQKHGYPFGLKDGILERKIQEELKSWKQYVNKRNGLMVAAPILIMAIIMSKYYWTGRLSWSMSTQKGAAKIVTSAQGTDIIGMGWGAWDMFSSIFQPASPLSNDKTNGINNNSAEEKKFKEGIEKLKAELEKDSKKNETGQ